MDVKCVIMDFNVMNKCDKNLIDPVMNPRSGWVARAKQSELGDITPLDYYSVSALCSTYS